MRAYLRCRPTSSSLSRLSLSRLSLPFCVRADMHARSHLRTFGGWDTTVAALTVGWFLNARLLPCPAMCLALTLAPGWNWDLAFALALECVTAIATPGVDLGVGSELHGEDNYLSNVIVFDYAKVGVLVDGAATLLSGVHTWNGGGVGISINGSYNIQDRILGCYLDYNYLQIVQPYMITVENTFFYYTNARLFPDPNATAKSWRPAGDSPRIEAVVFSENTYFLGKASSWGANQTMVVVPPANPATPFVASMCSDFVVKGELSVERGTLLYVPRVSCAPHIQYPTALFSSLFTLPTLLALLCLRLFIPLLQLRASLHNCMKAAVIVMSHSEAS